MSRRNPGCYVWAFPVTSFGRPRGVFPVRVNANMICSAEGFVFFVAPDNERDETPVSAFARLVQLDENGKGWSFTEEVPTVAVGREARDTRRRSDDCVCLNLVTSHNKDNTTS